MSRRPSARRRAASVAPEPQVRDGSADQAARRSAGHPGLLDATTVTGVRIDKWLWAARFFKTRSLAAEAVEGGRVRLQGDRPKSARQVRLGDLLEVRTPAGIWQVRVTGLADRRGPASVAQGLYAEDPDSRAARERLAELRRSEALIRPWKGRPTKRERRAMVRFRPVLDAPGWPEEDEGGSG